MKDDFQDAIRFFFRERKMIPAFNSSLVAPVCKISNVNSMTDFIPISCCSIMYKTVTKIIANRLQAVLPDIVFEEPQCLQQRTKYNR